MSIRYLPLTRWWHWIICLILATSGLGVSAAVFLTKSPEENNCSSESHLDTAAAVIYCATMTAADQDAEKLSKAIELVNTIPQDSPLRPNVDNLIQRWSHSIMHLSQKAFQEGDLRKAVEIAEAIPANHPSYQDASEQIKDWQSLWSQAEDIYKAALSEIDNDSKNWYAALSKAKQLQTLKNDYWANTKYYELMRHIQGAREDRDKAKQKAATVEKSDKKSDIDIDTVSLSDSTDELSQLEKARKLANSGKIDNMRAALVEASMVISDQYHQDARKLIADTENKIAYLEDSSYLNEAKKLANKNDEISLKMAINEASLIEKNRPLYKQANQHITMWNKKILQTTAQPVKSTPASNITVTKAPKVSSNKNQNQSQNNQPKPFVDNSNITDPFSSSLEQLEDIQINELQSE